MSDPADLDRLIAKIQRDLRAERKPGGRPPVDAAQRALDAEIRRIRGPRLRKKSIPLFLFANFFPVLVLLALAFAWHYLKAS